MWVDFCVWCELDIQFNVFFMWVSKISSNFYWKLLFYNIFVINQVSVCYTAIPSTLFFFFKRVLAILGPLCFKISLLSSRRERTCWDFHLGCMESIDQVGDNLHFYYIAFFSSCTWDILAFNSSLKFPIKFPFFSIEVLRKLVILISRYLWLFYSIVNGMCC